MRFPAILLLVPALLLLGVTDASATQIHTAVEGPLVHQLGHLFFLGAMALLIYWLRERRLDSQKGWRLIQYAALFFILWNVDAFVAHFFDDRSAVFRTINAGHYSDQVSPGDESPLLVLLYYIARMDHLLCVPGIVCLYLGLCRLLKDHPDPKGAEPRS